MMREFAVALFLISGVLKAQLLILLPWFPDLTLIAVILLVVTTPALNKLPAAELSLLQFLSLFAFFGFVLAILASALYSPSSLVLTKSLKFSIVIFAFIVALSTANLNWTRFAQLYIRLTIVSALMFVYIFPKFRLGLLGNDAEFYSGTYLGFADACAISLYLTYFSRHERRLSFSILLVFFLLFCILLSGARAPLIFFTLLVMLWGLYRGLVWTLGPKDLDVRLVSGVVIIIPSLLLWGLLTFDFKAHEETEVVKVVGWSIDRLALLVGEDKGESVNVRVNHVSRSLNAINSASWSGVGFGAYSLRVLGEDRWDYPHNMILEVWVESGLSALAFLMLLLGLSAIHLAHASRQPVVKFILIYCLLNAMKSSSYADNRVLFFWVGALIVLSITELKPQTRNGRSSVVCQGDF